MNVVVTGVYTLTPTHVGTSEADLVVDLPVAREAFTRVPCLPGTGLKGVARAMAKPAGEKAAWLGAFGSEPPGRGDRSEAGGTLPGSLQFGDGQLLAWPSRSLNAPTLWTTCPLLIERVDRLVRAYGEEWLPTELHNWVGEWRKILEKDPFELAFGPAALVGGTLVVEDLGFRLVRGHAGLATLAERFALLLPAGEPTTERLTQNLVVISDEAFVALVRRAVPVHARVQLTDGKTTSEWEGQKGNLWYEEVVPADTLFASVVTGAGTELLWDGGRKTRRVQVGGNETVGQGQAWWTRIEKPNPADSPRAKASNPGARR